MFFEGLAGCGEDGKGIEITLKSIPTTIPKSITNQCRIDARKNDAQSIENYQNGGPKGPQNHESCPKEAMWKICILIYARQQPQYDPNPGVGGVQRD